ncbi:MAG TPA: aquaporin [Gemmatimonadaceae bacterium]|nr:aquaporin [Gemmatimonadaceae bacterium]
MRHMLRHFVAEFIGTFALVFIGGLSYMTAQGVNAPASVALLILALAHGLIYGAMIGALMRVSGHFNPAVTIGFLVARRLEGMLAGVYIVAQLLGAVLASYVTKAVVPIALFTGARGGGQVISLNISGGQAFTLEAIATFFLVWVVFGAITDQRPSHGVGVGVGGALAVGATLAAAILVLAPFTGASLNPARSLGPAVATGIFEGQIVFWTAPLVGGALAGLLYDQLFLRRGPEPADHGAVEP